MVALAWYSVAIHRGITRYAYEAGWILDGGYVRSGYQPGSLDVDGVLSVLGMHKELDRHLKRMAVPIVNIGYGGPPDVPSVAADGRLIGQMAAEHFSSRGFRNFAYFMWSRSGGEVPRWEGFRDALAQLGHTAHLIGPLHDSHMSPPRADLYRYLSVQLEALAKPVGVFCEYDDHSISVLDAALMSDLRVPEQVAVLGVDNDELRCPFAPIPLSSIDNNEERIGYEAAKLLDGVLQGQPTSTEPVLIPPRSVIVRQSTNILAIPHEEVAMALRLIWQHYTEPIDVIRVAERVPLSYPQLHATFVKHVGHSMAEELTRRRLEHAQRLLSSTEMKVSEIARLSGFGSSDRIGRVFMRKLKMSPSDYRDAAMTKRSPGEKPGAEATTHLSDGAKPALLRPTEGPSSDWVDYSPNRAR